MKHQVSAQKWLIAAKGGDFVLLGTKPVLQQVLESEAHRQLNRESL
jgi:hypothetical protein